MIKNHCYLQSFNTEHEFFAITPATGNVHIKATTFGTISPQGGDYGFSSIAGRMSRNGDYGFSSVNADGKIPMLTADKMTARARIAAAVESRALQGPNCAGTGFLLMGCGPTIYTTQAECDATGGLAAGCGGSPPPPPAAVPLQAVKPLTGETSSLDVGGWVGVLIAAIIITAVLTTVVIRMILTSGNNKTAPLKRALSGKDMVHVAVTKQSVAKQPSMNFDREEAGTPSSAI